MNFELSDEQKTILSELAKMTAPYTSVGVEEVIQRTVFAPVLQAALIDNGYLDLGVGDRESATTAALIIAELAKLPVTVEAAGSALVRHVLAAHALPPVSLIQGDPLGPVRFLPQARSAFLIGDGGTLSVLELEEGDVEALPSLFGYPMGRLHAGALAKAKPLDGGLAHEALRLWRVGIALEIAGALAAALQLTIEHVRDRFQFGRPLGSFQAVQHRLAKSATHVEACMWLALKAANTGEALDAMVAAAYAQNVVKSASYDFHQFSGAMGLTLEYSLHLFTYRAKLLQSELGGSDTNHLAASDLRWGRPE